MPFDGKLPAINTDLQELFVRRATDAQEGAVLKSWVGEIFDGPRVVALKTACTNMGKETIDWT